MKESRLHGVSSCYCLRIAWDCGGAMRWFLKENFADESAILCAYGIL